MAEFYSQGHPSRFEIAIRPRRQRDPVDRWPSGYGWSLGDLRITIGNRILTQHIRPDGKRVDHVTWYLLPIMEWLAANWIELLHEEEFGWQERSSAGAATVVPRVLAESAGKDDQAAVTRYELAQAWRARHALRATAEGGLLPDLYLRRFLDSIELSWTDTPPPFAPDGFRFVSRAGYAACTVDEVATPLWDVLSYVADGGLRGRLPECDRPRFHALASRIETIRGATVIEFAAARIAPHVMAEASKALADKRDVLFRSELVNDVPAIAAFSPAVAMYGGLDPDIRGADVGVLSGLMLAAQDGGEAPELAALVRDAGGAPRRPPPLEGHALAEELLEEFGLNIGEGPVELHDLFDRLGITIEKVALDTDTVRGVALAGQGMRPTIVVNATSYFNDTPAGERFTLAHELCHILFDRGRARRVGISSGPWAPPAVEMRANAFAAMLLMPRSRVIAAFSDDYADPDAIVAAAEQLSVTRAALIEHLFNIYLIDEPERERLRGHFYGR